ncbi:dTDP-glucose 4,6-dehydratase [Streptomyces sp. NPDC005133]
MRTVVTGGAGFIGSQFVRELVHDRYEALTGADVVVLDRFTYAGNPANLAPVADSPRLRVVQGDICDPVVVQDVLRGADLVVHFAAESHVDRSIAKAGEFVRTNVLGTQVLLDAALRSNIRRFVHVSTDEVYGSIERGSWDENSPLSPNSPYAASKASSDVLALSYQRTHGLPVCVTRCSNTYGPHQYPEKAVPRFITRILRGQQVPLYGDGQHIRDWVHVEDHCRGVALVAAAGKVGELYHIGGGTELTNEALIDVLLAKLGVDWSRVERVPDRKGHDRRYSLDIRKARGLGYRPRVSFEEGIVETIKWYQDNAVWWQPLVRQEPCS